MLATHEGRHIAASVYFFLGHRSIYKYGASDYAWQQLRGSNLVMWAAMKWLAQRGIQTLDLGKTSLQNAGLQRFKLNFGAQERRVEYLKYDYRRAVLVTESDGVDGWHNAIFRRMPRGLSRVAGRLLYRHWA